MAIVYQHVRKDNGQVFYIGIGKKENRSKEKFGRSKHWHSVVKKYGYKIQITHKDICWEEACKIEQYLISFYGRKDLKKGELVNKTDGGEGAINLIVSEEIRQRYRKERKGIPRPYKNEEQRKAAQERASLMFKGKKLDKPRSEEYKLKLSLATKGKKMPPVTQETRLKLSVAGKGKKRSLKTREKMKLSNKRTHKEETRKKISETKKIRYYIKTLITGIVSPTLIVAPMKKVLHPEYGIFYESAKEAANLYGYNHSTLKAMLNGARKNKTNLKYV